MPLLLALLLTLAAGDDPATVDAKAMYARGKEAFEAGRTAEALADFEGAYARKPLPGFLFNIALCHRALKSHGKAVEALERYLRAMPNAPNKAEAGRILEEERAYAAAQSSAPPPTPPPPPATAPPPGPSSPVVPPAAAVPPIASVPPPAAAVPPAASVPPPAVEVPTPAAEGPAKPAAPAPDVSEPPHGMGAMPVAFIQGAAGLGACVGGCCVSAPFACLAGLIPIVGPFVSAFVSALIIGPAIAIAEVWVGDGLGQKRAALVWPVVLAIGAVSAGALTGATLRAVTGSGFTLQDGNLTYNGWVQGISAAAACGGIAAAVVGPIVLYNALSVDKQPGDTGGGFPGFLEPADPTHTRGKAPPAPSSAPKGAVAMRY